MSDQRGVPAHDEADDKADDWANDRANGEANADAFDGDFDDEPRVVRPYTMTRGRTRSARSDLPLEALVRGVAGAEGDPTPTPERRRILELTSTGVLSVAELSAHLSLPLGVVRVLVGDLADDELVIVHTGASHAQTPATNLKVLESVLNGISSL